MLSTETIDLWLVQANIGIYKSSEEVRVSNVLEWGQPKGGSDIPFLLSVLQMIVSDMRGQAGTEAFESVAMYMYTLSARWSTEAATVLSGLLLDEDGVPIIDENEEYILY